MSESLAQLCTRRDGVTIPTIWVAFALSLLIHGVLLWRLQPQIRLSSPEPSEIAQADSLVVRLSAPPILTPEPPSPPLRAQPTATPKARSSETMLRPKSVPSSISANSPAPDAAPPPVIPSVSSPPARPSIGGDLTSYIEAQRRARTASALAAPPIVVADAQPVETDEARTNRIVAANLASPRLTFGYDPARYGGTFIIQRTGYNDAEFMFYGWNPAIRRNIPQPFEVKRGSYSSIDIAVVRKIISIIREQVHDEDFQFGSQRLGRSLMLSARPKDDAELEKFLLDEYFYQLRPR